jgi:hypothetical protein
VGALRQWGYVEIFAQTVCTGSHLPPHPNLKCLRIHTFQITEALHPTLSLSLSLCILSPTPLSLQ